MHCIQLLQDFKHWLSATLKWSMRSSANFWMVNAALRLKSLSTPELDTYTLRFLFPIWAFLSESIWTTSFFTSAETNSLLILIKAKLVRRSCSIDDLVHVFINFTFENDLSQLAIENPMVGSSLYAIHKVGKTFLPNCIKHSRACLRFEGTAFPLARRSITKSKVIIHLVFVQYIAN